MHDTHIMPIGPQHPALKEPMFLELKVNANKVKGLNLHYGYMHKGIEKLFENSNLMQGLIKCERICGICSYSHSGCFSNTIEKMVDLDITRKTRLSRTIVGELERIHSHLVYMGILMHTIGLHSFFMFFWKERESIMDCFDRLTGNRVHHAINYIGGVRREFSKGDIEFVFNSIAKVRAFILKYYKTLESKDVIKSRFKEIGTISKSEAKKFDLIGPNARASGLNIDVRVDKPYELYSELDFDVKLRDNGDSFDRMFIRMDEILESIKIVFQCIKEFKFNEKINGMRDINIESGKATSMIEALRGELFYYVKVKNGIIKRAKVRTPTFAYMNVFPKALEGLYLGDVPVALESFDPCFSCMERVLVVEGNNGMVLTKDELGVEQKCK